MPRGSAESDAFHIGTNKEDAEHKASAWILQEIYCESDGEIAEECSSSITYLSVLDKDDDTGECRAVPYCQPKDGNRYERSLKEIFTSSVIRQIKDFDMSNEIKRLKFRIEEAKDDYYRK